MNKDNRCFEFNGDQANLDIDLISRLQKSKEETDVQELQKITNDFSSSATFRNSFLTSLRRKEIYSQASLIAVTNRCIRTIVEPDPEFIIDYSGNSNVKTTYPANQGLDYTTRKQPPSVKYNEKVTIPRTQTEYSIDYDTQIGGNLQSVSSQRLVEATESLANKIENHVLESLIDSAKSVETLTDANAWNKSTSNIRLNLQDAFNYFANNTRINFNGTLDAKLGQTSNTSIWSLILPTSMYARLRKEYVVDGQKFTLERTLNEEFNIQTLYSRKPFEVKDAEWKLGKKAILIPTNDPYVGNLHTWNGTNGMGNVYVEEDRDGVNIVNRFWFKYHSTPNQDEANDDNGVGIKNRRVYVWENAFSS